MDDRSDINRLLAALAERTGTEVPPLDEAGQCVVEVEGVVFFLSHDVERRCLYIQSRCGSLARAGDADAVLEAVLEANYLWQGTAGGVLGLDERTGELGLAFKLDFPLPDEVFPEDLLLEMLPRLIGVTEWCRDLIAPEE